MSQTPRFIRARQLTASVLPGRRADGYENAVSGRLRKIAAAGGTGALPFSGRCDGAIYFRDGKVTYAESGRTPGPTPAAAAPADAVARPDAAAPAHGAIQLTPLKRLTTMLAVVEPTIDAALELMSSESRCAKFRPERVPADTRIAGGIGVEALLAEVARRHRFLKQLSPVLTADTAIARNPHIRSESLRVSALQWALLIRVRQGSTPRDLARELSHSVFGTTAEVYRLLNLRLLYIAGHPAIVHSDAPGNTPDRDLAIMSFTRAAATEKAHEQANEKTHEKGTSMPEINAGLTLGDAG